MFHNNEEWEILTPDGWSDFTGVAEYSTDESISFRFDNGSNIEVTPNHPLLTSRGWKKATTIRVGSTVISDSGKTCVVSKVSNSIPKQMYDPAFVSKDNRYYANGIVSHNTSISLLFCDEVAFIPGNQWEEFFNSVYPTISSGEDTKVVLVSTPKGLNHYYKLWNEAVEKRSLFVPNEINWWDVPGRDAEWQRQTIANIGQDTFDQEFGAEFLGSSGTLINSQTLRRLVHQTPITTHNNLKIYQNPIDGHQYVMTVDCSEGVGSDSSVFSVIDITSKPYNQVAVYKNNKMNPLVFPDFIYQVATKYNHAFVLIETNSVGKQVADTIHYEFGYENLAWVGEHAKFGQILMGGNAARQQNGLRTDKRSKRIGCSNAKQLIESNLLTINDYDTIMELSTFVQKGTSFEADEGTHDDLVMTLVILGWMSTQSYFQALNDSDARNAVLAAYKERLEAEMLPMIMSISQSADEPKITIDASGIMWREAGTV